MTKSDQSPFEFEDTFSRTFKTEDNVYFNEVTPAAVSDPEWVSINLQLADELGLQSHNLQSPKMLKIMSGDIRGTSLKPISVVYSGHQFGVWAGQLGDGRAITLGEHRINSSPTKYKELWDVQLKGAGTTPYSRFADGRAVLRSSIREYLCSEAMNGLGIPTTRALSLISSSTPVYRDDVESAAILCRVARSHIRFGSFEHFHYRNQTESVRSLADYVITRHFPEWLDTEDRYINLMSNAVLKTAETIAHWQAEGFAHGVMNTDNMSILGETIDYGPFGFLDAYNPDFVCNSSDINGRYSFKNQPAIGLWNLNALATALTTLIPSESLIPILKTYEPIFLSHYRSLMSAKLGLQKYEDSDEELINRLLALMNENSVDYSLFFRKLCSFSEDREGVRNMFIDRFVFDDWADSYSDRFNRQDLDASSIKRSMLNVNPKYILRNYMAQNAIEKAIQGDYSEVNFLLEILQKPYEEHPTAEHYAGIPPDWADQISVSCSS